MSNTKDSTTRTTERLDYVQGLRELANFIEEHNEVPLPYAGSANAFVTDKAQLAIVAKACGGQWAKNATADYFYISKPFAGGHAYEVNVAREEVCRKVVTGTRIIAAQPEQEVETFEWVCNEPLLASGVPVQR